MEDKQLYKSIISSNLTEDEKAEIISRLKKESETEEQKKSRIDASVYGYSSDDILMG